MFPSGHVIGQERPVRAPAVLPVQQAEGVVTFPGDQPASHQVFTTRGQLTEAERRDQPPPYRGDEQVRVKSWVMFLRKILGGSLSNNESDGNEVVKTRTI